MSAVIEIPANVEAEQAVLGAIIQHRNAWDQAREVMVAEDFFRPGHALIWAAVAEVADTRPLVEPLAVMQTLRAAGNLAKIGAEDGAGYLARLIEHSWTGTNVAYWAKIVHDTHRARRALQIHQRMAQVFAENAHDHDDLLAGLARENLNMEVLVDERALEEPVAGVMSWPELWAKAPNDTINWLIPQLMVREDVFMLLAGEGGGKSWFSRQFCLALAAGVHPFRAHVRIDPVRTLLVDLENAEDMVAYESRMVGHQVARLGDFDSSLARVWIKEDGLDLRTARDQMMLERVVAEHRPQLLALGSLYKAFRRGRDDWDTAAEEVRVYFDRLRRRYGLALLLEHHMPKGTGGERPSSPYGSSEWQRWASLGRIINRVGDNMYELAQFRGDRMQREMPYGLTRGGELPWTPVWDEPELMAGMWDVFRAARAKQGAAR